MRTPSGRVLINTVAFRPAGPWSQDAAGGRVFSAGGELTTFAASVQQLPAEDVPEHMREQNVNYWRVLVHQDPSPIKARDQVILVDMNNVVATVRSVRNAAGRSATWEILATSRIPQ